LLKNESRISRTARGFEAVRKYTACRVKPPIDGSYASPYTPSRFGIARLTCGLYVLKITEKETLMANTSSAKKNVRKMARKTAVNKARRSAVRTNLRRVEDAITAGDKAAATEALKAAEPSMMRAVSRGVFHKNTASRKISRLSKRVKAIG